MPKHGAQHNTGTPVPQPARVRRRIRWPILWVPLVLGVAAWAIEQVHQLNLVRVPRPGPSSVSFSEPVRSPAFDWDEYLDALGIVNHARFTAFFKLGLVLVGLALVVRLLREVYRRVLRRGQEAPR